MESKALPPKCQIYCLEQMPEPLGKVEIAWQLRNRIKRIIKRRLTYIHIWLSEHTERRDMTSPVVVNAAVSELQAGDRVRVKSSEEIQATLNRWNQLKGTSFTEEMWPFCGTTQQVMKRVNRFLDERDYRMKKCKGMVSLAGIMCEGTIDYGLCDRSCYFFWREEWLEKID
jgi:hypothetical protein